MVSLLGLAIGLCSMACGPRATSEGPSETTSGSTSETTSSCAEAECGEGSSSSESTTEDEWESAGSDYGGADTSWDAGSDGSSFIRADEPGAESSTDTGWEGPCDPLEQPCPEGEKCTAVGTTADAETWDALECVPIAGDLGAGEACLGALDYDGIDDCGIGLICIDADPDTYLGHCVAFCDEAEASCSDGATCTPVAEGLTAWCLPG